MNNNIDRVLESRKKYFNKRKFGKYSTLLDTMEIPEKFDYLDCIPCVFDDPEYEEIKQFKKKKYSNLYKEVKKYVNENIEQYSNLDDIIVMVHPFYPGLRHANFLIKYKKYFDKYLKYEEKIEHLLTNSQNNIILFESPDNFARYTYYFLNYGSIKKVVFTEHSTGKILSNENIGELNILKNKRIIICGCYRDNCIKDVENQLKDFDVTIVEEKDLILNRAVKI